MPGYDQHAFLEAEPPHWVARGLAYVILSLFVLSILAAILVHVPETVSGRFMLVPRDGADPVRALKEGVVSEVRVHEGDPVPRGATLMIIHSAPLSDRSSELLTLVSQRRTDEERLHIAQSQYETKRRADDAEAQRLQERLRFLEDLVTSKQHRFQETRQLADSALAGMRRGSVGRLDATRLDLEATTLAEDVQVAINDREDTRAAIQRLQRDEEARDLDYRETKDGLEGNIETERIRIETLQRDLVNLTQEGLVVSAPCAGTVLRLYASSAGAVVQAGQVLSEVACAGHRLEAQFDLPQSGVPLVRPGQGVKLRFDAFPYQRYGVQGGTVRWLGSAGQEANDTTAFRALIDLARDSIRVQGQARPLLAGMGGRADVVVGRRSIVSYAFEPIRALRENLSESSSR
ncbi:MAG TPA: HlyD family efflux transporter periplasmic adaptor subunit [Gemmatimonadales bacterium]|nr:HlyD family efflux transporter periplasmic adaptor subunit [Gemmatimonadales bacterium]